jgi:predicted aspartyl protease
LEHRNHRAGEAAAHASRRARQLLRHVGSALLLMSLSIAAAQASCQLTQMEIPVRIVNSRPIATLTLNGTEVPMLLDSGAFYSMLSPAIAAELKLPLRNLPHGLDISGVTGPIDAKQTLVEKVGLLGAELRNIEFLVGGNELGSGIMGLLGRNILSAADTEYDLAHGAVRLSFPKGACEKTNFAHWAGQAPVVVVPLEPEHHKDTAIRVNVGINGKPTLALLDSGVSRTALTLRAARRAGIEERDLKPSGRVRGAGAGWAKAWTGNVALFELGGEKIANNRLTISDIADRQEGMLVGLDYFLSHRIYVSRLQRQMYITWNGGPVFAQGDAAAEEYDRRYAALPKDVAKDDADALARRGAAALAAKNYQRALDDLNRANELSPGVAGYRHDRAQVHLAMRESRLALADLDEALRLDPLLNEARLRRASMRASMDDRPGAEADLAQLDAVLPPSSDLRAGMGHLYASFRQAYQALRQFDLWVRTHSTDAGLASVLNARCWLRARLNIDLPLALEDCKAAVDNDDGSAANRDSLGWTYLRLGDATKAKKAFDGAIKLESSAFSLYGRGLAQLRLNDATAGQNDLAAARKLQPLIDEDVRKAGFEFAEEIERLSVSGS